MIRDKPTHAHNASTLHPDFLFAFKRESIAYSVTFRLNVCVGTNRVVSITMYVPTNMQCIKWKMNGKLNK